MEPFNVDLLSEVKRARRGSFVSVRNFLLAFFKILAYCALSALVVGIICLIIAALNFAPYYSAIKTGYGQIKIGQAYLESGKNDAVKFNLDTAKVKFQLAGKNFEQANAQLNVLKKSFLSQAPMVSEQINLVMTTIDSIRRVSGVLFDLTDIGQKMMVAGVGIKNFGDLSEKNKVEFLSLLDSVAGDLKKTDDNMQVALHEFENFQQNSWLRGVFANEELGNEIYLLGDITGKLRVASDFLPEFLGYLREKTYLFLLMNNSEMRPGGGFLGTYGVVKVLNADIEKFFTDNIYNLDKKSEATLNIPSPEPMKKYMSQPKWFMRDANWSPDFSESAKKVEEFYALEKGEVEKFDGVIGVTPTMIASLLKIVGPIEVDGLKFTADNFTDTLQYEVEYGYKTKGVAFQERKSIVGKLGIELQTRLFKLPLAKIGELATALKNSVEQKQMVFYFNDPIQQAVAKKYEWAGLVKKTAGDYLMVVDANLAALKTDPFVKRSIQYTLSANVENPSAELKIKYDHQGKFDLLVTRYRSWTRVYLPKDIEILDVQISGKKITDYVVSDELDKKVVGLFLNVEPQTSEVIMIKYKFGKNWQEQLKQLGYSLIIQKQIGLPSIDVSLDLTLPKNVPSIPAIGTKISPNRVIFKGVVESDFDVRL
ncbi:MAG: DUF4012 domain-containing protein [Candidatus Falkowbacteria bacterium]